MKKYIVTMAILALGLTACNKVEVDNQPVETPQETPAENEVAVYQVSIPASMGAETKAVDFGIDPDSGKPTAVNTFAEGDKVYVYNETKGAMACDDKGEPLVLTPEDFTDGGKSCTLTGTLSFHKYENNTWTHVSVEDTDSYKLLYNLNEPCSDDPKHSNLWYSLQNGTAAGVADYAIATTTLNNDGGVLTTTSTVSFTNLQSMFRFKFIDESTNAINVKHLVITSNKSAVASYYSPLQPSTYPYAYDTDNALPVTLAKPTTDYIYVALCIKESVAAGDELTFKAIDADGKVYTGTKAAPTGGFVNGKYYYNSSAVTLTHDASLDITAPNIVWTSPGTPIEMNYDGEYTGFPTDFDITLSGTSRNCYFLPINSGTVRLNGINATYSGPFFGCGGNLTVELQNGSANTIVNTIVDTYGAYCIGAATLKLSGNGTLTMTAKSAVDCGIRGTNNYSKDYSTNDNATTTAIDVSTQLAAEGYSVIRCTRTDNSDGTYTWTYTVRPLINLSSLDGDYLAQDGDVLTGTLTGNHKISIADGATVTLAGVSINADGTRTGEYNGITCLGNATINLADGTTNNVRGMNGSYYGYSGIFVPHNDAGSGDEYTLTIQGNGTLNAFGGSCAAGIGANCGSHGGNIVIAGGTVNATGGAHAAGIGSGFLSSSETSFCGTITISYGTVIANGGAHAAGIGSGEYGRCGDITISGGTVTANGGESAAGIGSGYSGSCYNIYINSGTVTANGGARAAGIGNGEGGSCDEITITTEVTKVTATKGSDAPNSIGPSQSGSCESVEIGCKFYWQVHGYVTENGGEAYLTQSPLVYPAP